MPGTDLADLKTSMKAIQDSFQQSSLGARPRDFVDAPLRLYDYDGLCVELPWEYFRFWPVVQQYLRSKMGIEDSDDSLPVVLYHGNQLVKGESKWEILGRPGLSCRWWFYESMFALDSDNDEIIVGGQVMVYSGKQQDWLVYFSNSHQQVGNAHSRKPLSWIKTSARTRHAKECSHFLADLLLDGIDKMPPCANHPGYCKCVSCVQGESRPCYCRRCSWFREYKAPSFACQIPP